MMNGLEDVQKLGKDNMDQAMKSIGSSSKGMQSLAVDMADYSNTPFENSASTF